MANEKKCKVKVSEKGNKIVVKMKGFCDPNNPKKRFDNSYEMDMGDIDF